MNGSEFDRKPVATLVSQARAGDRSAWADIVGRFAPLVLSVCRRYCLAQADAEDVLGTVWLTLVEQLASIRDPAALPGWLATTASRACLQLLRQRARQVPSELADVSDALAESVDTGLLADEQRTALRDAINCVPHRHRILLAMLFRDHPASYAEVSSMLAIPIGAIGPTRQRCLARLRLYPRMAALLATSTA